MAQGRAAAAAVVCETEVRGESRDRDERWTEFQQAAAQLRARLSGNGASDLVLPDLLEDDLRQARIAVLALGDALERVLQVVGDPKAGPSTFVEAARRAPDLKAVDSLTEVLPQLRKRLLQVAQRLVR